MSGDEAASPPKGDYSPCAHHWCTTPHGATLHESDEDHRSDGRTVELELRSVGDSGEVDRAEVEVGLLRRRTDSKTWLVIEDGRNMHVEVAVDSARDLLHALRTDAAVARQLGLAGGAP